MHAKKRTKTKHLWFITSVFSINKNGRKTSPTFYHYADNCFYSPFKSIFSLLEMDFLWDSQRGEIQPHTFRPRPDCMTHFYECYHNFNIQGLCTPSLRDWVFLTEQIGLRVCGMMFSDLHEELQANVFRAFGKSTGYIYVFRCMDKNSNI